MQPAWSLTGALLLVLVAVRLYGPGDGLLEIFTEGAFVVALQLTVKKLFGLSWAQSTLVIPILVLDFLSPFIFRWVRVLIEESQVRDLNIPTTQSRTRHFCIGVLMAWALLLPNRILREEFVDYLLQVRALFETGHSLQGAIRTFVTIFWTGTNAVGYFLKLVGKRSRA